MRSNGLIKAFYHRIVQYLEQPVSAAPLVTFRIGFGIVMLFSTVRYMAMGWVDTQLIDPILHFHYYGFEWVKPLPGNGMYIVFIAMMVSCLSIIAGFYYRIFAVLFFLCFTYVELIDITFYLNHYYFVSIIAFLLIFVPANRYFSMDVLRKPHLASHKVSRWTISIFMLQIAIVYVYAGLAKINYDWLFHALPLAIWLPAKTSLPVIGPLFAYKETAFVFSWAGMLFDTFIVFGLLWRKTRWIAYAAVIIFHALTGLLFQIGIFPLVMIFAVTIFFPSSVHEKIISFLSGFTGNKNRRVYQFSPTKNFRPFVLPGLLVFFLVQLLFPWRYKLYPDNLFWTEEGYRFSWRVMLMEKAGTATFYVKDGENGREGAVINRQFLSDHQEKQMAMQPDLILQFAHFLENHFMINGMIDPVVRAEAWVTLNGRPAQLIVDPERDLTKLRDTWQHKDWILPYTSSR